MDPPGGHGVVAPQELQHVLTAVVGVDSLGADRQHQQPQCRSRAKNNLCLAASAEDGHHQISSRRRSSRHQIFEVGGRGLTLGVSARSNGGGGGKGAPTIVFLPRFGGCLVCLSWVQTAKPRR